MKIKLENEVIKRLQMRVSVKMLGVCINPRLDWNDEFECVKNKLSVTIKKVLRTEMKKYQAHVCLHVHMVTNVFLGVV